MTLTLFQKSATAIAIAGIGLTCLHTDSAQAALLHFSFTSSNSKTNTNGTGSFVLDTETPVSTFAPPLLDENENTVDQGTYYPGAVSNFTFSSSAPGINFAYPSLDFVVFPQTTLINGYVAGIGLPECSLPANTCPIQLLVDYTGNLAALPSLSSDPNDYSLFNVASYPDGDVTFIEGVTSPNAAGVPEPTVLPGLVAAGAIGGFLRKRLQMRQKRLDNV